MATKVKHQADVEEITQAELDDLEVLQDEVVRDGADGEFPLIRGGKVVYIGPRRNCLIPLLGRILDEPVFSETEFEVDPGTGQPLVDEHGQKRPLRIDTLKTCISEGLQAYDFSSYDSKGRPIRQHRMPAVMPKNPEIAGRRYVVCEHPEHLRLFDQMKDGNNVREFRIMVPKRYRAAYDAYVGRKNGRERQQRDLLAMTQTEGA